jgi:carboxyl-terminal processing protease
MIDRHSASASEIVAGALQDTGRAIVVGDTQSHGKGTVQTVLPMGRTDNGSMKITTARLYRINGSSTQVKGVASDICLPSAIDERTDIGEDKLPNALPWSRIEPVPCEAIWNMGVYLDALRAASRARTAASEEWAKRYRLVAQCRMASERKTVPLAYAERKKMMREDRAVLDAADDAMLDETEDGPTDETGDGETDGMSEAERRARDIVLTETMNVLADLVRLTEGREAPQPQQQEPRLPAWLKALGGGR